MIRTTERLHLNVLLQCIKTNIYRRFCHYSKDRLPIQSLDAFANPTIDYDKYETGRNKPSFICDPYNYISSTDADKIDAMLLSAKESELLEMGIAIIPSFKNYGYSGWYDTPQITEKHAKSIHDEWEIGDKHLNNGLLIFISINDRYMYISTGSGIKNILTDDYITNYLIQHKLSKYMKRKEYGEAMIIATQDIIEVIKSNELNELNTSKAYNNYKRYKKAVNIENKTDSFEELISVFGWAVIFVAIFIALRKYIIDELTLEQLVNKLQDDVKNVALHLSCPICLDYFHEANIDNIERLSCGHNYCSECLKDYNIQNNNYSMYTLYCPICKRKQYYDEEKDDKNELQEYERECIVKELELRLIDNKDNKNKYGDMITREMIGIWVNQMFDGDNKKWSDDIIDENKGYRSRGRYHRRRRSRRNSQNRRNGGSGGSGYSFGGGSSSGGGGGGGSW